MFQIQILMSQEWILTSHLDNTKKERERERELNTCINQIQMSQTEGQDVSDSDFLVSTMNPDVSLG